MLDGQMIATAVPAGDGAVLDGRVFHLPLGREDDGAPCGSVQLARTPAGSTRSTPARLCDHSVGRPDDIASARNGPVRVRVLLSCDISPCTVELSVRISE
jgi:hypothetical protein